MSQALTSAWAASTWSTESGGFWPGHHVTTAVTAGVVGLAVVGWRAARRAGVLTELMAWPAAVVAPLLVWWVMVSVHAGYNATGQVGDRWLTTAHPSIPWPVRAGWQLAGHGEALRWALPVVFVAGLLVDARRLYAADRGRAGGPLPPGPFDPSALVERAPRGFGALVALVAYVVRDLGFVVAAGSRQLGESRWTAMARGRAGGALARAVRERAMAVSAAAAGGCERGARARLRLSAVLAVFALLAAAVWLGPHEAGVVGHSHVAALADPGGLVGGLGDWFAAILDALAHWWNGLSPTQKVLIGVGVAVLVAASGGSLGLAFGVSGVVTYTLDHAEGEAAFVRDPDGATRSYLAHATPMGLLTDTAGFALTFAPGNFAGAVAGRGMRTAAQEYLRDPEAFWAARQALRYDDTGAVRLDGFGRKRPNTWPEVRQDWDAGRAFNAAQWHRYPVNEVTLSNGKVLDSYTPNRFIVSRKHSQLADIEPSTAEGYLKEITGKYPRGAMIADTPKARAQFPALAGQKLKGKLVLEVPVQTRPIPQSVLDYAAANKIQIRDVTGRVYR